MTMNSMAVLQNIVVVVEAIEAVEEEVEAGEEEVTMTTMVLVIKGVRCPSQGIMTTMTVKKDRFKSFNELIAMLAASTSQASKKIKIS